VTSPPARAYPDRRPLQAVLVDGAAGAGRLLEPLARALDGSGPAVLPVDASLPAARIRKLLAAFRPDTVVDPDGGARSSSAPRDPPGSPRGLS